MGSEVRHVYSCLYVSLHVYMCALIHICCMRMLSVHVCVIEKVLCTRNAKKWPRHRDALQVPLPLGTACGPWVSPETISDQITVGSVPAPPVIVISLC